MRSSRNLKFGKYLSMRKAALIAGLRMSSITNTMGSHISENIYSHTLGGWSSTVHEYNRQCHDFRLTFISHAPVLHSLNGRAGGTLASSPSPQLVTAAGRDWMTRRRRRPLRPNGNSRCCQRCEQYCQCDCFLHTTCFLLPFGKLNILSAELRLWMFRLVTRAA